MPEVFRLTGRLGQAAEWTPEQVRGDESLDSNRR